MPDLQLMNDSFRQCVLQLGANFQLSQLEKQAGQDTWGQLKWPFLFIFGTILLFFFFTQHEFKNSFITLISLKRTWKPRPLGGEETFSRPEAGPGCDTMGGCPLNAPAMRCMTRNTMWCGLPNTGSGLIGKISGDGWSSCSGKLPRTLDLRLKNWKWRRTMSISF